MPVNSFSPNPFGLYTVHGNVWEWVEDCWSENYSGAPTDGSAWTTGDCRYRVLRGGSWIDGPSRLRSAYRDWLPPDYRDSGVSLRLARTLITVEPVKVSLDGREFMVEQAEKRDFEAALTLFRKAEFAGARTAFFDFLGRYSRSGYAPSAFFWLGNAQYATRDYAGAMVNFRALIASAADHQGTPEAVLSVANCQLELKDVRGARRTLQDLISAYPKSEAAVAARERLAVLK